MPLGALILGVHAPSFTPNTPEHALARWVTSKGGFVGSVAAETRGGLRGLYVTRPVSAGELLLVRVRVRVSVWLGLGLGLAAG